MSLTFSLLKPPLPSSKPTVPSLILSSSFLHGPLPLSLSTTFSTLALSTTTTPTKTTTLTIKAMKTIEGRVVCATSDKTVAVVVTRLAPHPKYRRRVRIKKKFQAHDPDNMFKVGDWVQLEKCRPISKTKAYLAVVPPPRKTGHKAAAEVEVGPAELGIPLQSELKDEGIVEDEYKTV